MSAEEEVGLDVGFGRDRDGILAELRSHLIELAEGKLDAVEIDPGGHLLEHGYVDSLTAVMFVAHIAERYSVEIDDVELVERLHTLDALADHIVERAG